MAVDASPFAARLEAGGATYTYFPVSAIEGSAELPYALKVLLENVLRNGEDADAARELARRVVDAGRAGTVGDEVEFRPARVLFQDFTGVPVFVDFAVMREACAELGGDPRKINPQIPCDLVIDHSVIADEAGCAGALAANMEHEFERNRERYDFLNWAQKSFENVRIVPPGAGICHQLNIEEFASVVFTDDGIADAAASPSTRSRGDDGMPCLGFAEQGAPARAHGVGSNSPLDCSTRAGARVASAIPTTSGTGETLADATNDLRDDADALPPAAPVAYFDTLVGTDSHTPTANGIGVLGWGVGGIEAEAAALGQPITTLVPRVVGVRLVGELQEGVSAMDVALTFAQVLRERGVVGCFVECFGPGLKALGATQRTCISNMTPEYGCTCTLFPVDEQTLAYLRLTGRSEEQVAQGFWHEPDEQRVYAEVLEIDLSQVKRSLAGPSRPHDRIDATRAREAFGGVCESRGLSSGPDDTATVETGQGRFDLSHGAVAIAAITSCTTATNPDMMLAAGLLAKRAAEAGLSAKPWVKCVLAPGSQATALLLERAGVGEGLREVGFFNCGFGCMSCIGNSGPLSVDMQAAGKKVELASVLSGNRNFEGRISPDVSQNYLAAPALVVAYALAGTLDFDFERMPLGRRADGTDVFLSDLWPSDAEVARLAEGVVTPALYEEAREGIMDGDARWQAIAADASVTYPWDASSTYVRRAPYFDGMGRTPAAPAPIADARVLALLGDFITTDHISPAGSIAADSPAARYLQERGVAPEDFNTYGSRRGNHEVMMRGTFANVKLANALAEGKKGGWTRDFLADGTTPLFDAAQHYLREGMPSIVIAGKMYGSGSSRDWAAKGPALLGVRAALAESFERIHRSNLIGMGILPLQFADGENAATLGLDGSECYTVTLPDFSRGLPEPPVAEVRARKGDGTEVAFRAVVRVDTPTEGRYYEHGGILPYVLRQLIG